MLRVGLTGGLGSGKSTVAGFFCELGVHVMEADAVGRALMRPGQEVYGGIVEAFGPSVLREDGSLDRSRLAALAFDQGRLEELNRIVHPPVIAAQEAWMETLFAREPEAIAMVESALIFEAERGGTGKDWRKRFDRVVLVTAPEELKVARFVERMSGRGGEAMRDGDRERLAEDARRRLRKQIPDEEKIPVCDYVIRNRTSLELAQAQVAGIYGELLELSRAGVPGLEKNRGGQ